MPRSSSTPIGKKTANKGDSASISLDKNGVVNGGQLQQFVNSSPRFDYWTTYSSSANNMENINAVIEDIKRKFGQ